MAWDQLWIDKPHIAYALIGFFVTTFSLVSLFVKEKLYIGEATVAAIFGLIVGPHCLDWFAPTTWGNSDYITIEVSRIVLVVQIFAVAVELPKKYMLRHWLSVVILLLPVMTFGWMISSVFIWKLVPTLAWIEALVVAACVTATDPVLASAVVGKGKFARRVPGHLRNLLSAESGCNDGMAFPFAYLAINIINHAGHPGTITFDFIVITVLYECVFGCVLGAVIGYCGRHLIKFAEKHNLIDRESFLVFYFVLALFCTGVGSIIGTDDLLVAFSAGTAFAWDGWFAKKTEESHVSNVIDLLLNMAYFVYFGAIVPWQDFNNAAIGLKAWKLVILAILILLFRRIPIMMAMKPFVPDIRTWREALFCGHFGPIGVGAVFISILSRAELEHGEPTPLAQLPPPGTPHYYAIATIWPITTFLIISSIIVHGSSIAVFTLGKRLNNMTITMTYTTAANSSQSWLSRLPRIETGGKTLSLHKIDTDAGKLKFPGLRKRRRSEKEEPVNLPIDLSAGRHVPDSAAQNPQEATAESQLNDGMAAFQEGDKVIIEDNEGEVVATVQSGAASTSSQSQETAKGEDEEKAGGYYEEGQGIAHPPATKIRPGSQAAIPQPSRQQQDLRGERQHRPGRKVIAYQLDDDVIVENEDGEIIRRYRINRRPRAESGAAGGPSGTAPGELPKRAGSFVAKGMDKTLSFVGLKKDKDRSGVAPHDYDVEKNTVDDIVPLDDKNVEDHKFPFDDETIRRHLKTLLNTGGDLSQIGAASAATTSRTSDSTIARPESDGTANIGGSEVHIGGTGTTTGAERISPQLNIQQQPPSSEGLPNESGEDLRSRLPRNFLGPLSEDDSVVHPDIESQQEESDEETEVERKRRLAALGLLHERLDEDDEEEQVPPRRNVIPPPIREEDEEEPPVPKIHWRDDVR